MIGIGGCWIDYYQSTADVELTKPCQWAYLSLQEEEGDRTTARTTWIAPPLEAPSVFSLNIQWGGHRTRVTRGSKEAHG